MVGWHLRSLAEPRDDRGFRVSTVAGAGYWRYGATPRSYFESLSTSGPSQGWIPDLGRG